MSDPRCITCGIEIDALPGEEQYCLECLVRIAQKRFPPLPRPYYDSTPPFRQQIIARIREADGQDFSIMHAWTWHRRDLPSGWVALRNFHVLNQATTGQALLRHRRCDGKCEAPHAHRFAPHANDGHVVSVVNIWPWGSA